MNFKFRLEIHLNFMIKAVKEVKKSYAAFFFFLNFFLADLK